MPKSTLMKQFGIQSLASFQALAKLRQENNVLLLVSTANCEFCKHFLPHFEYAARVAGSSNLEEGQQVVFAQLPLTGKVLKELTSHIPTNKDKQQEEGEEIEEILLTENSAGYQSLHEAIIKRGAPLLIYFPQFSNSAIVYPKNLSRDPFILLAWLAEQLQLPMLRPLFIDFSEQSQVTKDTQFIVQYNGKWGIVPAYVRCLSADMLFFEMKDVQQYALFTLLHQVPLHILHKYVAFVNVEHVGYYDAFSIFEKEITNPKTQKSIPFTGWLAMEILQRDVLPFLSSKIK